MAKLFTALAIYGVVSILFSAVWIWVVYRTPSIGYDYPHGMVIGDGIALGGTTHTSKKEFYDNALWAAVLKTVGGLILFVCAIIHNDYTRHGHLFYAITAVYNCLIILTLTVYFLLLALGSQGILDWKPTAVEDDSRPIQCGIVKDFMIMYGQIISDADWKDMKGEYVGLSQTERQAKYHACNIDIIRERHNSGYSENGNGYHGNRDNVGSSGMRLMVEVKKQEQRVLAISIFMVIFGAISLLFTIASIIFAVIAWKQSGSINNAELPMFHQPVVSQTKIPSYTSEVPSAAPFVAPSVVVPSYVDSHVQPSVVPPELQEKSTQFETE